MNLLEIPWYLLTKLDFWFKKRFRSYEALKFTIGIGNIQVGGTGKTQAIKSIAAFLNKSDKKIAVISKGYKAKLKFARVISENPLLFGDEAVELYLNPNINYSIIANKKELGVKYADLLLDDIDFILIDDSFQNPQIKQDIKIVMFDASYNFFNEKLLPIGRLRQPFETLIEADCVIVKNSMFFNKKIKDFLFNFTKKDNIFFSQTVIKQFLKENVVYPISFFKNKEVILLSAIGNNDSFYNQIKNLNIKIIKHFKFKDHFSFTESIEKQILSENKNLPIICTFKDWVKLKILKNKVFIADAVLEIEENFWKFLTEKINICSN